MSVLYSVNNLSFNYGKKSIIDNISLDIDSGKFHVILGENGAGKSTFMKLLAGLDPSFKGDISISGNSILNDDIKVTHPMALITEDLNYDVFMSLEKFVPYFASFYPKWDQAKFDNYLSERNFSLDTNFTQLSRGQRVQFSLMLYLSSGVDIFIVDEVTSVLDLYSRTYFLKELKGVVDRGGTVIFATNIISEVAPYAQEVIMLKDTKVELSLSKNEIPLNYKKIIKGAKEKHQIFSDQDCFWAGDNEDGTTNYIISAQNFKKYEKDNLTLTDQILLEDVFVFYYRSSLGECDEAVA
jgi:ABC-2 type transport system ATP-binding protein